MKTGKLSESVLKRSVLKKIKCKRPEVIISAAPGIDCSAIELSGDEVFVISTDTFTDANEDWEKLAIYQATNNIGAAGGEAIGVVLAGLLPVETEEAQLKQIMDGVEAVCAELNIQAIGGHTQVTDAVNKPIVIATAVGKVKKEKATFAKNARAGQDLVITKWIGLEGTSILAKERADDIAKRYQYTLVNTAKDFDKYLSVLREAATAVKSGVTAMHDVAQGGVFTALWEFAEASGAGLTIDLKKIPVKQETIEICDIFDINPYRLLSGGSLLIACDNGQDLVEILLAEGINAAVIGKFTDSNDKIILNDGDVTYLDSPKADELFKAE